MKLPGPANPIYQLCIRMGALVVAMFVFAVWIMPPLYDVFCEITGLNGKTGARYEAMPAGVDESRLITVQFVAINNETMSWNFAPQTRRIQVHPGAQTRIDYHVQNASSKNMVGQAIPSLVPFKAASFFHKTECFCFEQQPLAAGESAVLPMYFIVDPELPAYIKTITLSYTLFDVTDRFANDIQLTQIFSNTD